MSTCQSCGGVIGRDCFNPQECAWITQAMQAEMAAQQAVAERLDGVVLTLDEFNRLMDLLARATGGAASHMRDVEELRIDVLERLGAPDRA